MPEKLQELYRKLNESDKYEGIGKDFDSFKEAMMNPDKGSKVFSIISHDQDLGVLGSDYNSFLSKYGLKKKDGTQEDTGLSEIPLQEAEGQPLIDNRDRAINPVQEEATQAIATDTQQDAVSKALDATSPIIPTPPVQDATIQRTPVIDPNAQPPGLGNIETEEVFLDVNTPLIDPRQMSEGAREVYGKVEDYYNERGWESPSAKMNKYHAGIQDITGELRRGEVTKEQAIEREDQLLLELGLYKDEGDVKVPDSMMEPYNEKLTEYNAEHLSKISKETKDPFLKDAIEQLNTGSAGVLAAGDRIMAISERAGNLVAKSWGGDEQTYWQDRAATVESMIDEMRANNVRYDGTITELLKEGEVGKAAGATTMAVLETIPHLTVLAMGNAAGLGKAANVFTGVNKGSEQYLRLGRENPEINEVTKIINSVGVGLSEYVFEGIGTMKILNGMKKTANRVGSERLREEVLKSYTPYFERQLSAVARGSSPAVREAATEMATQAFDNSMNKASGMDVDWFDGVADAGIVGAVVGQALHSASAPMIKDDVRGYVKRLKKFVPKELDLQDKVAFTELMVAGDLLEAELTDAPAAMKPIIKEKQKAVEEELARLSDLSRAGDILAEEAADKAPDVPVEKTSLENDTSIPQEGEDALESSKTEVGKKSVRRADDNVEYLDADGVTSRINTIDQAIDAIEKNVKPQLPDAKEPVSIKGDNFRYTNAENLLGSERAKIKSIEEADNLINELRESKSALESELKKRESMPEAKEGEVVYGSKVYPSKDALKEDLRKIDDIENLPMPKDIEAMRAMSEVKVEKGIFAEDAGVSDKKTVKKIPGKVYSKEQIDEVPGMKARVDEINEQAKDLPDLSSEKTELLRERRELNKEIERREKYIKKQQDESIQEPITEEVDVEQQPQDGETMGEGDAETQTQEPTGEVAREGGLVPKDVKPPAPPTPPKGPGATVQAEPTEPVDGVEVMKRARDQRQKYIDEQKKRKRPSLLDKVDSAVFDMQGPVKRFISKVGGKEAERFVRDLNLKKGSSANAAVRIHRARSRVFGDPLLPGSRKLLNDPVQGLLGDAISAQRVLEIESGRERKRDALLTELIKNKLSEQAELKKGVADQIEKIVTDGSTVEDIMSKLNEFMPDQLSTDVLNDLSNQAFAEFPSIQHEAGMTKEAALDFLQKIENKDQSVINEYGVNENDLDVNLMRQRAEEYYSVFRESLEDIFDAGIISEDLYNKLLTEYPYYSPRMYMEFVNMVDSEGGMSGVQALKGGSEGPMITQLDILLSDNIQRSSSMAFNNRMLNSMAEFARANPDNGMFRVAKQAKAEPTQQELPGQQELPTAEKGLALNDPAFREQMSRDNDAVYEPTPDNMTSIDYFENGVKKRIWMDQEYYDMLYTGDKAELLHKVAAIGGWVVGTPILRAAATGYNPEFAVKNIPLDALHQMMVTSEYSAILPKAVAQMSSDMKLVMKDASLRKGRYLDFIKEGGGMEFMSDQGKFKSSNIGKGYSHMKAGVKEAGDIMGYIGNTSEVLMRLAIRERAMDNRIAAFQQENGRLPNKKEKKEIQRDATAVARSYVDFNQGGYVSKALNNLLPYFNAGMQVGYTSASAIKKNPALWGAKVLQLAGVAASITAWNMGMFSGGDEEEKEKRREAYLNQVSSQVKGNNFVIMTPLSYEDNSGKTRYTYIKLPLDAFVQPFTNLVSDMMIRSAGDMYKDHSLLSKAQKEGAKGIIRHFGDISSLPPLARAYSGYTSNYDSFYNDKIWHGRDVYGEEGEEFYKGYTPERFVALGKIRLGDHEISPVRAQYFAKQFMTGSNLFGTAMGEGLDAIARKIDPELKKTIDKQVANELMNTPGIRRFLGSTSPYLNDDVAKATGKRNAVKTVNDRKLREIMDSELSDEDKIVAVGELIDTLLTHDINEAKRISNYHHMMLKGQDISNNPFSDMMMINDASARAELYHEKTKSVRPEQRNAMDEQSAEIIGLWSPSFATRLIELREQENQQNTQDTEND